LFREFPFPKHQRRKKEKRKEMKRKKTTLNLSPPMDFISLNLPKGERKRNSSFPRVEE
jgi:hypothetical protein